MSVNVNINVVPNDLFRATHVSKMAGSRTQVQVCAAGKMLSRLQSAMVDVTIYRGPGGALWVLPEGEFNEKYKPLPRLEDVDPAAIVQALLRGHLAPLTDSLRQAYLDAGPRALYGEVGEFSVIVDFEDDGTVVCEATLGEETALVNLAEGTWQAI